VCESVVVLVVSDRVGLEALDDEQLVEPALVDRRRGDVRRVLDVEVRGETRLVEDEAGRLAAGRSSSPSRRSGGPTACRSRAATMRGLAGFNSDAIVASVSGCAGGLAETNLKIVPPFRSLWGASSSPAYRVPFERSSRPSHANRPTAGRGFTFAASLPATAPVARSSTTPSVFSGS